MDEYYFRAKKCVGWEQTIDHKGRGRTGKGAEELPSRFSIHEGYEARIINMACFFLPSTFTKHPKILRLLASTIHRNCGPGAQTFSRQLWHLWQIEYLPGGHPRALL